MSSGKGSPQAEGNPEQGASAESLWDQIERERSALAAEREQFDAERAAWQGAAVRADDRDTSDLETRIAQQQARLDAQRRELEETRSTLMTREAELDALQLDVDRREATLEQQRREIVRANEELLQAREEVQRLSESLETDQASRQVDRLTEFYRQQQAEIDAEREQLRSLREEVRQERTGLSERLKQLEEGQAEVERCNAALAEHQEQLDRERRSLEQQREQFGVERAELTEDHRRLEEMQAELARQQEQFEQERLELRGLRDRAISQQEQLDERRAHLEAEQTALASRSEAIEKQRSALAAQREKLVARQEELDAEHAQLKEAREQLQQEAEEHRAELREKLDQFEEQLTQVTERGRQLSARQAELDEREHGVAEAERAAAEEQARRRAEIDREQKALDEHRAEIEAEEQRIEAARKECDQRAAELTEHMSAFATDREHILSVQAQFDARTAELEQRSQHLGRVEAELNQQREQIEARRDAVQTKETALAGRHAEIEAQAREFEERRQVAAQDVEALARRESALKTQGADLERREAALAAAQGKLDSDREADKAARREKTEALERREAELQRRREALHEQEAKLAEAEKRIKRNRDKAEAELKQRLGALKAQEAALKGRRPAAAGAASLDQDLAEEAERLAADRRQLDEDRQNAARQLAEERKVLEERRQETGRLAADLEARERRLAEEVAALEKAAAKGKEEVPGAPVVIETGGFSLRRALVLSTVLAAVSAVVVVSWLGLRQEVKGAIRIETEASPAQALPQHAAMLNTPLVIEAAARKLNADMEPEDVARMVGPGGEIQVRIAPEQSEILLAAVTKESAKAEAVINALGDALVGYIQSRATSSQPSEAFKRLQGELREAQEAAMQHAALLAQAERSAASAPAPTPSVEKLAEQRKLARTHWEQADKAWVAAIGALSSLPTSQASPGVDAETLRKAVAEDRQHQQISEQLDLRTQKLRSILVDGLDGTRAPLTALAEKVEAFDVQVSRQLEGDQAADMKAALKKVQTELAACKKSIAESGKAAETLLGQLRRQGGKQPVSVLEAQRQADKLVWTFVDGVRERTMDIQKRVQAIAQTAGEDMTRRIVVQDALKKQAQELATALSAYANAGADVIPGSNPLLDGCVRQIDLLRQQLSDRDKQISAGMEKRARDRAAELHEQRLAAYREEAAEQAKRRSQAWSELRKVEDQLDKAGSQQRRSERARQTVEAARQRLAMSKRWQEQVEARLEAFRNQAGTKLASDRQDRASFTGAFAVPGLANRAGLVKTASGWAVFVFATTWLVSWLVSGGRQRARSLVDRPVAAKPRTDLGGRKRRGE